MLPFEKLIRSALADGAARTARNLKGLIEAEWASPRESTRCAASPV